MEKYWARKVANLAGRYVLLAASSLFSFNLVESVSIPTNNFPTKP